ncbi:unnamed protein product, partial [Phaeothamnion confervicola]
MIGLLQLPWRPFYDMLVSKYLVGANYAPECSSGAEGRRRQAFCDLIHTARHYWAPGADVEIWAAAQPDFVDTRSHDVFRGATVLLLFLPTDTVLYLRLLPSWMRLWGSLDHCPAWDALWLTLFCRARKHCSSSGGDAAAAVASPYDWAQHLPQLFTAARLALRTPIGQGRPP